MHPAARASKGNPAMTIQEEEKVRCLLPSPGYFPMLDTALSFVITSVQVELDAIAKHEAEQAQQLERDAGFVSSRTATVRGAIASLGNMAIAEDMDFSAMFKAIDVRSITHQPVQTSTQIQSCHYCLAERQERLRRQDGTARSSVGIVAAGS